ncbi:MAG TPA: ABC transporter permease [Solirubrobacterales bacterium]|nr:ABC transporter permease [Solirubrobacterales bacterium]
MSTVEETRETTADRLRRLGEPRSVAIAGICVGVLAFWLSLPPFTLRNIVVPATLAVLGAAMGLWGLTRGQRKLGIWALLVSLLAVLGAIWFQGEELAELESVFSVGLLAATLRFATPLAFAAMGGIFSERSGVVNIGLEGMMLAGAFFGIMVAAETGQWELGILGAMAAGGALALVHAVFCIHLQADQIISGFAINFLALGLTGYLFRSVYGDRGTPELPERIPDVRLAFIDGIPFIGDIFGQLNLMIWLMILTVILSWVVLFKTPLGLRIRSVGEHPRAADTVGISVFKIRYAAVITSGILAGLGGAYLSFGFGNAFNENMTVGRGYIALAAVIFGNWRPFGAFGACLLFGFSSALALRLQGSPLLPSDIASGNLLQTLPYVLTLIALVGVIGRSRGPAAAGRPYVKQ